mmetsp:Transcript_17432/g.31429  ORF Transcript_17432/g.31429 Transcript_17432/m.31429 type:complete len:210 (-) Transcript_17432:11-640(-)
MSANSTPTLSRTTSQEAKAPFHSSRFTWFFIWSNAALAFCIASVHPSSSASRLSSRICCKGKKRSLSIGAMYAPLPWPRNCWASSNLFALIAGLMSKYSSSTPFKSLAADIATFFSTGGGSGSLATALCGASPATESNAGTLRTTSLRVDSAALVAGCIQHIVLRATDMVANAAEMTSNGFAYFPLLLCLPIATYQSRCMSYCTTQPLL